MKSRNPTCSPISSLNGFLFSGLVITLMTTNTTISSSSYDHGNETDHLALLSFKSLITHDPYGALSSWNTSFHFCDWSGVTCGKQHQRVIVLHLNSKRLEGSLSPHVGNLSFLRGLRLANNSFQKTIPHELGRLFRLRLLNLEINKFIGVIPTNLSGCSNLEKLGIGGNELVGSIPKEIGLLLKLTILAMDVNLLTGGIPPSLGNITSLEMLGLTKNPLGGRIPDTFGHLESLKELYLDGCNFTGSIPHTIYNLSHLARLSIARNQLSGSLPMAIGMLQNLQVATLNENQFSGSIPDTIGNLSRINILVLSSNKLEGVIPSSLGSCYRLERLDLDNNRLSGNIPKQLLQLSSLSVGLDLSQNNLFGSLPSEVGDLKMLTYLNLSHNNLSGIIPSSLSGCTSLSYLYLNNNLFQGMLPPSLSSMRGLEELDLSHNNFSSQIPRFLEGFLLQELNMSFNNFEGEVPLKGVFANATGFSIVGNTKLCGGIVELGLPKCKGKEKKKHRRRFRVFVILSLIASTLLVVSCVVYVLFKKIRKVQPSQSSPNGRFLKVSYNQLNKATDGFCEGNLIGKGGSSSVYKGVLEHDERFVAVKVLHLQTRGAHNNFIRECEAWRSIRHRNLLKIITSCSSIDFQGNDFKALVYEFMPNGCLHDWLHSSAHACRLNLNQRINILIDVASALDYLHNCCVPTIVHCDLKPSNILLDDDMVAHVGDFGLARFLGTNSYLNISSGIKGTIGYAPPEYGLGSEMTSSGDVYSFGIMLLEVMTGKNPTNDIFNEDLSLRKFVSMALVDQAVTDVIDSDASTTQSTEANVKKVEECLASTLQIGLSCSADSATQRMKIENVVRELHHIMDDLQKSRISS